MEDEFFKKYFHKTKNVTQIKDSAYIVIDTNVLLSAYQWKEVTLKEVLEVLRGLSSESRLKIPSHVFKEFIDQRPKRILEIIQKIDKELLSRLQKPPKLVSFIPFLDILKESEEYYLLEKEFIEKYDSYRKIISELSNRIKLFLENDPVLDMFKEIIQNSYFEIPPDDLANLDAEIRERVQKKMPPLTGGDSGKRENSTGDYLIWKHILSLKKDVIFVTTDKKDDWVLKDHHGNILSPRRELIEEFYESSENSTFTILSPKDLVTLFKPEVSTQVTIDLDVKVREETALFKALRTVFNKRDPSGLFSLTEQEDEYNPEVRALMGRLPSLKSKEEIAKEIKNIFEDYLAHYNSVESYYELAEDVILAKLLID